MLGERWSLLILRDMLVGTTRFNDLARGLPGLSRSLLTKRLRQFERAGLVERLGSQYLLTEAGRDLEPIVFGLGAWGAEVDLRRPRPPTSSTPSCWCGGCTPASTRPSCPGKRHVLPHPVHRRPRLFWIVIESRRAVGVPGRSRLRGRRHHHVRRRVALPGVARPHAARRRDAVGPAARSTGPAPLTRRMPDVFQLSPIADIVSSAR